MNILPCTILNLKVVFSNSNDISVVKIVYWMYWPNILFIYFDEYLSMEDISRDLINLDDT